MNEDNTNEYYKLTAKQYMWLRSWGDRGFEDVFWIKGKPYIYINGYPKKIPNDKYIQIIKKRGYTLTRLIHR